MNLLEIIQQYLEMKRKETKQLPGLGQSADEWLNSMASDNEWPSEMKRHIRGCWIDRDNLALAEARRILELYEIDPKPFSLKVVPVEGRENDEDYRRVQAIHRNRDYYWIGYEITMYIRNTGSADDDLSRINVLDPENLAG